ncbi:MAG: hypothetical protein IJT97_05705 [Bacteroidaceae bacterium]|nr:hypothetical protein [Bacteroidaceae bacterium]
MKTYLVIHDRQLDLEGYLSLTRTIVTLGRKSDEVYNVIALEDDGVDVFQCQFVRSSDGWKVQNGQWRTECPKGIRSRLQHACSMCMGRCVNPQPAHPTYSWRDPQYPTLLNGVAIGHEGAELHDGDILQVSCITLCARR